MYAGRRENTRHGTHRTHVLLGREGELVVDKPQGRVLTGPEKNAFGKPRVDKKGEAGGGGRGRGRGRGREELIHGDWSSTTRDQKKTSKVACRASYEKTEGTSKKASAVMITVVSDVVVKGTGYQSYRSL